MNSVRLQVLCLVATACILVAMAFISSPQALSLLLPAFTFLLTSVFRAYQLGTKQGFVIQERDLPRVIYKVVFAAEDTPDAHINIILLKDNNNRFLACKRGWLDAEFYFTVQGKEGQRFFVPNGLGVTGSFYDIHKSFSTKTT